MRLKSRNLLTVVLVLAAAVPAMAGKSKKVAVLPFDDSAVRARVEEVFGRDVAVGAELARQVAEYLRLDATYELVAREKIDRTRAKDKYASLDLSDPAQARRFGKGVKADAVLVGEVTYFGKLVRRSRRRGSKNRVTRAAVYVSIRLIETKKGKVLVSGDISTESPGSGKVLLGGGGFGGFGDGPVDLGRGDFHTTPMGQAVASSIEKISTYVIGARDELGVDQFSITASIASVEGERAKLNLGQGFGLKVGDRLAVKRVVSEKKKGGVVLSRESRRVAVIEIVALDDVSTTARVVYGDGVQVGDEVRIVMN